MKALFLITGLYPGGAEKIVLETIRNLLESGHTAAVVSLQKEPKGEDRTIVNALNQLGVSPFFLDLSVLRPWKFFTLLRIIRKEAPDVVHSHLMHANLTARLARLFRRFPLVNTIHIAERRKSLKVRILFLLDRLSWQLCDLYTAVSKAAAEFHEQKCGLPQGTVKVVYNGSDPAPPLPPERIAAIRREWGLDGTARIIGSVGRLDHQKGYDIFLAGLTSLKPLIPPGEQWGIVLIGDGPERDKLRTLAGEISAQMQELKVVLPGYRPDAASLLPMLDLFVMPSRYEGFGLTLTEAMAQGIPALCSKADSLPELCASVPENTMTADFTSPDLTEIYRKALQMQKQPGKIFRTTKEMTAEYIQCYQKLSAGKRQSCR